MTGSDGSGPDMILKVPKGCSIGMTNALHDYIRENGRIECFGTITISRGHDVEPSVPIAELEQLADEFQEKADGNDKHERSRLERYGWDQAAQGLKELIADYGGTDE